MYTGRLCNVINLAKRGYFNDGVLSVCVSVYHTITSYIYVYGSIVTKRYMEIARYDICMVKKYIGHMSKAKGKFTKKHENHCLSHRF